MCSDECFQLKFLTLFGVVNKICNPSTLCALSPLVQHVLETKVVRYTRAVRSDTELVLVDTIIDCFVNRSVGVIKGLT